MDGPNVRLDDLRLAVARLLDRVEAKHGPVVDLDADLYWTLAGPDAYELESAEPTVGQLTDDVTELGQIPARADDELVVWHDLAHIAAILQRIAVLDLPA